MQARAHLVSKEVHLEESTRLTLAKDFEFNSPSQAAMMMLACTATRRIEWKDLKCVTFKEHQERAAAAASAEGEGEG